MRVVPIIAATVAALLLGGKTASAKVDYFMTYTPIWHAPGGMDYGSTARYCVLEAKFVSDGYSPLPIVFFDIRIGDKEGAGVRLSIVAFTDQNPTMKITFDGGRTFSVKMDGDSDQHEGLLTKDADEFLMAFNLSSKMTVSIPGQKPFGVVLVRQGQAISVLATCTERMQLKSAPVVIVNAEPS